MALELIIDWQAFETELRGEKISMEIRPFKRKAMMAIQPFLTEKMPTIKKSMNKEEIGKLADKAFELQGLAEHLFPNHVRNITGITINGKPPTFEDLSEEPALLPLTLAIITQIASISALDSGEAKNSGGLSGSMEEQAGTDR